MRLRRLLSTTAALLSMCFCSASSATSSLSTYWLVSCRHWPQTRHTHTGTREHTQCNSRRWEKRGRGGEDGKQGGHKITERPRKLEISSVNVIAGGSESEKKNAEWGTKNWPLFLLVWEAGCQLCSAALHTRDETTFKRWRKKLTNSKLNEG